MIDPTEERFLKDVAEHEMLVLHEHGVYRHLRFKRPGTGCMHFDLITYPGYLVYSGDMGCFVFSRLEDMFVFFRTDRSVLNGRRLAINLGYWSEKLQAVDGGRNHVEGVKEFDEEKFTRCVMEDLVGWIRHHREECTKEERRALWEAVLDEVIGADSDSGGYRKQCAVHDFSHRVNADYGDFYFQDFFEHNVTEYTFRFVWCCYAIAWGVLKYDEAKALATERAA